MVILDITMLNEMVMWLPVMFGIGIGGGGAFNFSKSESDFRNEQGISQANRNAIFPAVRRSALGLSGLGQSLLQGRGTQPNLTLDRFGFLTDRSQPNGFNTAGFIQQLLSGALGQTAAQRTARGQVAPENLKSFALDATQSVAGQLLPLIQSNLLQAQTLPAQFGLQRAGLALQGPTGLTQLATGGGSGSGSSDALAFGFSGNAKAGV